MDAGEVKPLHVQIAEALGPPWDETRCRICGWPLDPEGVMCRTDSCSMRPAPKRRADEPPRYDTDWSATGPLLDAYDIEIELRQYGVAATTLWPDGVRRFGDPAWDRRVAVCNLLLALKAAGKL